MKRGQIALFCGLMLASLFLIAGCGDSSGITGEAIAVGSEGKIKIGALLPLSGDGAVYGENIKNGIELALEDDSFEVIYEDSGCDKDVGVDAVKKLIKKDKVGAIIGGICNEVTLSVIPIAKEAGIVMVSPAPIDFDLSNIPEVSEISTVLGNQFFKKYKKEYGSEPPVFAAEGFDAALVVNEAILNSEGSKQGVVDAMKDISFEGASGPISFKEEAGYYFIK